MLGMDGPDLEEERALEVILQDEKRSHRKIRWAKVTGVSGGKIDVELLDRDNFLGKDNKPAPQRVTLKGLPLLALGSGDLVVGFTPAVGAEVMVVCSDRSVKRHIDAPAAEFADVVDVSLHGFNGASVLPFEISEARLFEGGSPDTLIVGSKDNTARVEFDAAGGNVTVKANGVIKLGSSSANIPVADANKCKDNDDILRTHTNLAGSIVGVPPLPALSPVGFSKVKAE